MTVERVSAPPGSVALSTDEDNERDDGDDATIMARATICCPHYFPSPLDVALNYGTVRNMLLACIYLRYLLALCILRVDARWAVAVLDLN